MNRKLSIFLFVLVFTLITAPVCYAVNWIYSFEDGMRLAQEEGKPVMVDFYTEWCGYCKKLDKEVFTNSQVNELANKFVCVKINADNNPGLSEKYNVRGFPTIVFLDSTGKEIDRIRGYKTADSFAEVMRRLLPVSQESGSGVGSGIVQGEDESTYDFLRREDVVLDLGNKYYTQHYRNQGVTFTSLEITSPPHARDINANEDAAVVSFVADMRFGDWVDERVYQYFLVVRNPDRTWRIIATHNDVTREMVEQYGIDPSEVGR